MDTADHILGDTLIIGSFRCDGECPADIAGVDDITDTAGNGLAPDDVHPSYLDGGLLVGFPLDIDFSQDVIDVLELTVLVAVLFHIGSLFYGIPRFIGKLAYQPETELFGHL